MARTPSPRGQGVRAFLKIFETLFLRLTNISDGSFALHGDNATRIRHLKRIIRLLILLLIAEATVGFANLSIAFGVGSVVNWGCAIVCAAFAGLLVRGCMKLNERKQRLEKDAQLFE